MPHHVGPPGGRRGVSQEVGRGGSPRGVRPAPCGKGKAEQSEQLGAGEFESLQDGVACRGFLSLSAAWSWVRLGRGNIGGRV